MEQHVQYSISGIERLHMVLSYNSWALKKCSFASCWTWYQMRPTKTKRKKKEGKQKEKMHILNIISTIEVLFAILQDWQLAKAELVACNSQAQYLQLFHEVKYLQPGEGKNKVIFPTSSPAPAWQSKAKHKTCSRKPRGTRVAQVLHLGLTSDRK